MERNSETRKKAAKRIREAAEHAGHGEYNPALEQINETIKEINGIYPVSCEELEKVRKLIEMYLNSEEEDTNNYTEGYIYNWLESIAEELESSF